MEIINQKAGMNLEFDRVKMNMFARRDIPTETVRVYVDAMVAATAEEASSVPEQIRGILSGVLAAEWMTSFASRSEDSAGMEQIVLNASARVTEAKTSGLSDRLRRASRSGLSLKLRSIEFRPPQTQIDEVITSMREEIYLMAQREVDVLNRLLPSTTLPWKVGSLNIVASVQDPKDQSPAGRERRFARFSSSNLVRQPEEDDSQNLVLGVRVELQVEVIVTRLAVMMSGVEREPGK